MTEQSTPRLGVVVGSLMLVMALAALDQTIVATALPTIVGDLGRLDQYAWVVTAYLLTQTVSTPLFGKFGDLYGRKRVFQVAIVTFLIGSALCGASQSMAQLVAFRAVQGVGAGGLMVGSQALIADLVAPRDRARYQGLFAATWGLSSVAGPLLGGFIVDHTSWRWVFLVNLPLGAAALFVIGAVLSLPTHSVRHRIDYLGATLLTSGVTCVVLLTTWGGAQYAWSSPRIIGLAVAAALLLGVFLWVETRAEEPVVPLSLFRNSVVSVSSGVGFIVGFALFGTMTYLPQYLQIVQRASPTRSGLQMFPLMAGMLLASIGSGLLISRRGRYRVFPIAGTAVMTVGMVLLSRLDGNTTRVTAAVYVFILGVGLGLVSQVLVLAVQNSVDARQLGTATSTAWFARAIGGSIGVSVFAAIFNAQLDSNLGRLIPGASARSFRGGPEQILGLPVAIRDSYITAFTDSLHVVFLTAVVFTALAFALTWRLQEFPLRSGVSPMSGVTENFGMSQVGVADVLEEVDVRLRAARAAELHLEELIVRTPVPPDQISALRRIFSDRIAYLAERSRLTVEAGDSITPETWALVLELQQIERRALVDAQASGAGASGVRREATVRMDAAQAALARLDELAGTHDVPAERVVGLRQLFESRIADYAERRRRVTATADQASPAFWQLAVELLELERRELAGFELRHQVSPQVADRVGRDLDTERAELAPRSG